MSSTFAQTATISGLSQSAQEASTMIDGITVPFHMTVCGASGATVGCGGVATAAAWNGEAHEVSCCSDTALGDFIQADSGCPYAGRMQSPLECIDTPGPTQNSFQCGAGTTADPLACNHNASYLQVRNHRHLLLSQSCECSHSGLEM